MIKGTTTLDMRGRCSAGQKVIMTSDVNVLSCVHIYN